MRIKSIEEFIYFLILEKDMFFTNQFLIKKVEEV